MRSDYIDALRYSVDYEAHYLGKWNIEEEISVDMSKKLQRDLNRIFHGANPLEFIEDARMMECPDVVRCEVTLRVPSHEELVMRQIDRDLLNASSWVGIERCPGVPKAPEPKAKKIDPMEAVDFLKPRRIIYSGPKTIVFWPDGTKTIVSLMEGQEHDEYGAFCAAVVKKMFGATHKAKQFLDTVKSYKASNPRRPKNATEESMTVEVFAGSEEVREVPVKPWETTQTMPMPGTEDPDWGRKHWAPETVV